ncbi:hypothetical protein K505DRAFT_322170 [Melanomma pulvis-pyrius CBS 109.77]|uniref:DUF1330 domain-containing protein n=1 Tax=Melanomma pulvis-pyrius CBS 109.77 TaxID=1314802 RepID=A0A6A6XR28_9PLEO|nr:hypothetical protein K505DRAFT_322170 [Melanomma pulvis-pyrius CBS 109.77]
MSSSGSPSEPTVNTAALQTLLQTFPKDKPVHMLNLLRYRPSAVYSSSSSPETKMATCTGREAYHSRYLPAVKPFLKGIGAEIIFFGKAWEGLIEGADKWDEVLIVRYPSVGAFSGMAGNETYQKEAAVHRTAAIGGYSLMPMELE